MKAERKTWKQLREERLANPEAASAYAESSRAYRLGRDIKALREARGLSQRQLGERIGTTQSAVARLEAGGSPPSLSTLERVAEALGVEIDVQFREPAGAA